MNFKVNQTVAVVKGKYEKLVGIVNRRYEDESGVQYEVEIHGVKDGKPVNHRGTFVEDVLESVRT